MKSKTSEVKWHYYPTKTLFGDSCRWFIIVTALASSICFAKDPQKPISTVQADKGIKTMNVTGEFTVTLDPQTDDIESGRYLLNKEYQGALSAVGKGQMLSYRSEISGSAGYVALETVKGTLDGLEGSFVLLHKGVMNKGAQDLVITVVPDSGTDALKGISGTLDIKIEQQKHFYTFNYILE